MVELVFGSVVEARRYLPRFRKVDYPDYGEIELDPELSVFPTDQLPQVYESGEGDEMAELLQYSAFYRPLAAGDRAVDVAPCPRCEERTAPAGMQIACDNMRRVFSATVTEILLVDRSDDSDRKDAHIWVDPDTGDACWFNEGWTEEQWATDHWWRILGGDWSSARFGVVLSDVESLEQ